MKSLLIPICLIWVSYQALSQKVLLEFRNNPLGLVTDVISLSDDKLILKDAEFLYDSISGVRFRDNRFYKLYSHGLRIKNVASILDANVDSLTYGYIEMFTLKYGVIEKDTTNLWRITTIDANEYFGTIISNNGKEIKLKTEKLGLITIQVIHIQTIKQINSKLIVEGELWMENPQSTRYFWAPNGYGLKAGEGYYQNVWVLFNQASFGISENTSLGFGLIPTFLFGASEFPIWITPKFSIPIQKDQFNIGGGALIGTIIGIDARFFGIAYGVATFGDPDKNLNIGLGYGFADNTWASNPTITLSAMRRTGKRGYFITENYFISKEIGVISLGGRVVWTRISLDYGFIIPIEQNTGFLAIPWLGFVVPFGNGSKL